VEKEEQSAGENEKTAAPLPIFSIKRLELARPFDALPISNDEDLMSAVEQGYDEFEEDEEVRDLAVRVLAAFKKRNSVETLSQIALYDLSSGLRSKAVNILSEFDHESVFETILLANADPTREVRAAAARSLSKLTFDRADAWSRIAETGEEGRMVQAARAAIESGFVEMSFDRLVHPDYKYAYEAFALMALLIKAGETEKIFNTLENHRDMNVRRAILHTIKVTKDQKALDGLYSLLEKNIMPLEFQEEIDKTIEQIGFVTA
jgi:HEAT repeat protein